MGLSAIPPSCPQLKLQRRPHHLIETLAKPTNDYSIGKNDRAKLAYNSSSYSTFGTAAISAHYVACCYATCGAFRNCYSHSIYIQSKPHPTFTWCIFVLGKLLFSYTHIPRGYSFSLYLFSCLFLHLSRHLLVDLKSPWPCLLWYVPIAIVRSSILTGCASPYCPLRSSRQQSSLHHKVLDLMARQPYQVVPMRLSQHRAQHQPPHKRAIGTPRTFLHKTSGSRGNVWRL